MKAAFLTLGCKVNQYETQVMEESLIKEGFTVVPFDETADVYIVNTCTVTAVSDKKSRQALHRAKRQNPNALVVAAGCYPQAAKNRDALPPECDLILGNTEKARIADFLKEALSTHLRTIAISDINVEKEYTPMQITAGDRTRIHLKIQDGCNNFCSYCMIPYARGRVRSKSLSDTVNEFSTLLAKGYPEVVLTGIEIASYGQDIGESLTTLLPKLQQVCDAYPSVRIRLGSLEPRLITPKFIEVLKHTPAVCPHFHLSLQSGCDRTLGAMNRKYDTARYFESITLLRDTFDDVAITTDIIVGFPGENEEDFSATLQFVEKVGFSKVHVFPYSKRDGTPAAKRPDQIPQAEKQRRAKILTEVCEKSREQFLENLCGKRVSVLFEQREKEYFVGHTANYTPVYLLTNEDLSGKTLMLTLGSLFKDGLIATP